MNKHIQYLIKRECPLSIWFDNFPAVGIMITDLNLNVIYVNDFIKNHLANRNFNPQSTHIDVMFPEIVQRGKRIYFEEALKGKTSILDYNEHEYLLKINPSVNNYLFQFMPQRAVISPLMENGKVIGTSTFIEDSTEKIIYENELKEKIRILTDTQNSLFEVKERYKKLFDDALTGNFITTVEGKIKLCNKAFLKIFGFSSFEEAYNFDLSKLFTSDYKRNEFLDLLRKEKIISEFETKYRRKDGTIIHVIENSIGIFDKNEELIEIEGYVFDITKRKKMEQLAIEKEKTLRAVLDTLPVGVWIADKNGNIIQSNPAGRKIWAGEKLVGIEDYNQYEGWWYDTGIKIESHEWATARAIEKGETSLNEKIKIKCFDGSKKVILNSALPILDENENIIGGVVVNQDVTEQVKAETQLQLLKKIMLGINDAPNLNDALKFVITEICAYSHWVCGEIWMPTSDVPMTLKTVVNISVDEKVESFCHKSEHFTFNIGEGLPGKIWQTKSPFYSKNVTEEPHFKRSNEARECGLNTAVGIPVLFENEMLAVLLFFGYYEQEDEEEIVDIVNAVASQLGSTIKRKQAEEEANIAKEKAIEANRLKSGFLSIISHEIRTPMNSILGYLEIIEDFAKEKLDDEILTYFSYVKSNTNRLMRTLTSLVDISLIEAKEFNYSLDPLSISNLIKDEVSNFKNYAESRGLSIEYNVDDKLMILADEYLITVILNNLIDNAIKFSLKGKIRVSAKRMNGYVNIEVADQGIGISDEYKKHLFELFSQEDVSFRRPYEGNGLGLALCKRFVNLLKGKINVESKKGVGTKFTIQIPAYD